MQFCGGEFLGDGYFVRFVGDKVTSEVIICYIKYQQQEQLCFEFQCPAALLRGSLLLDIPYAGLYNATKLLSYFYSHMEIVYAVSCP